MFSPYYVRIELDLFHLACITLHLHAVMRQKVVSQELQSRTNTPGRTQDTKDLGPSVVCLERVRIHGHVCWVKALRGSLWRRKVQQILMSFLYNPSPFKMAFQARLFHPPAEGFASLLAHCSWFPSALSCSIIPPHLIKSSYKCSSFLSFCFDAKCTDSISSMRTSGPLGDEEDGRIFCRVFFLLLFIIYLLFFFLHDPWTTS